MIMVGCPSLARGRFAKPRRRQRCAGSNPAPTAIFGRVPLGWPATGLENRGIVRRVRGSTPQLSAISDLVITVIMCYTAQIVNKPGRKYGNIL